MIEIVTLIVGILILVAIPVAVTYTLGYVRGIAQRMISSLALRTLGEHENIPSTAAPIDTGQTWHAKGLPHQNEWEPVEVVDYFDEIDTDGRSTGSKMVHYRMSDQQVGKMYESQFRGLYEFRGGVK